MKVLGWFLEVVGGILLAFGVLFGIRFLYGIILGVFYDDLEVSIAWFLSVDDLFVWFGIPLAIIVGAVLAMGGERLAHKGRVK